MIIGTFTRNDDGSGYVGGILAIGFDRPVWFEAPIAKTERGPDFVLWSHQHTEIGAAWKRTGKDGEYLSVKLDSPLLPQPINCVLVGQADGTCALIWKRAKAEAEAEATA